jgi:hypothetical protein
LHFNKEIVICFIFFPIQKNGGRETEEKEVAMENAKGKIDLLGVQQSPHLLAKISKQVEGTVLPFPSIPFRNPTPSPFVA